MTKETAGQRRIGISVDFDDTDFNAAVALAKGVPSHLADAFVTEFERLFVSSSLVTSTRVEENGVLIVCRIGGVLEICARALAGAASKKEGFLVLEGGKLGHLETRRFQESELPKELLRGTAAGHIEFFERLLNSGGVSPWMTSEELSRRTQKSRSRQFGRFSALLIALSRLSPKSLAAVLKAGRLKGWRAKK